MPCIKGWYLWKWTIFCYLIHSIIVYWSPCFVRVANLKLFCSIFRKICVCNTNKTGKSTNNFMSYLGLKNEIIIISHRQQPVANILIACGFWWNTPLFSFGMNIAYLSRSQFPSAIGWKKKCASYNHKITIWVCH